MRRSKRVDRLLIQTLFIASVIGLVGHMFMGHAHADLLAAAPVEEHVPGDDHHQNAGGSCEALRAPAPDGTPVVLTQNAVEPDWSVARSTTVPTSVKPVLAQPPLFLLHASLLI